MNGRRLLSIKVKSKTKNSPIIVLFVLVKDPAKIIIYWRFDRKLPNSGTRSKTEILHRIKSDRLPIKKYGGGAIKGMNGRHLLLIDVEVTTALIVPVKESAKNTIFL